MADNVISRRPGLSTDSKQSEVDIAALVAGGGSSAKTEAEKKAEAKAKRQAKKITETVVNVRIPHELLHRIDELRTQRAGKVSRNVWILTAIEDQIERLLRNQPAP